MLLLEKFCSLTTFWSNQLHLSELNGQLGSDTSDLSLNHANFPCPFCTKIFDEKAEVVECLDTCVGTEDLSAMIRLSVMRKLRTISTTAISFMIPPCSFCPKIFKEKAEMIEPMEVQRYKDTDISNVSFLLQNLYKYWMFCETHRQSPLVKMQTLFVQWYALILTSLKTNLITMKWEYFMSSLLVQT